MIASRAYSASVASPAILLVVGYAAAVPAERELYLLFVHPGHAGGLYASAGSRPDGTVREGEWNGAAMREPRLVASL